LAEKDGQHDDSREITTVHLFVHGKVQGVFFRSSLKNKAEEFSVTGWTRNLSDGSVEALVQGRREQVKKLIDWCHVGPSRAQVEFVREKSVETAEIYRHFVVLT
jgi:acylphosphatase